MFVNIYQGRGTIGSLIVVLAFGLFLGAVALDAVLPNNDVNLAVGALVVACSVMALCAYGAWAVRALWRGSFEYEDWLIVGIALSFATTGLREVFVIIARLGQLDPAFLNSELWAFTKLGYPIAAVLHVLPRGAVNGRVPNVNKATVGVTFLIAVCLASALVIAKPSTTPLIDRMPWWLRDAWGTGQASAPPFVRPIPPG